MSSTVIHGPMARSPRLLLVALAIVACAVIVRLVVLERADGDALRTELSSGRTRTVIRPAVRGRILARDGAVLAAEQSLASLTIEYRLLENPPNAHWLREMARRRLSAARVPAAERRDSQRITAEEQHVLAERDDEIGRLQALCRISADEWKARVQQVQARVERLSQLANRAAQSSYEQTRGAADKSDDPQSDSSISSLAERLATLLFRSPAEPPESIVVKEELAEHVVCENIPLEAVAEIEAHAEQFPGARILYGGRRQYATPDLAPHVIGYVSHAEAVGADDAAAMPIGRAGVERQYDTLLRGRDGRSTQRLDIRGRVVSTTVDAEPMPGRDLVLTLDSQAQAAAQTLLDSTLARQTAVDDPKTTGHWGAAAIAMEVHSGAILAAATAPRFDFPLLAEGNAAIDGALHDAGHPLIDRSIQMAIAPGSTFKALTALALMHQAGFNPERPVDCIGYLHSPNSRRCMIYRRMGSGHGPTTLADALCFSCNVYFFHQAEQYGLAPLIDWSRRCGFGEPAGIDLPGEAAGHLPPLPPAGADNRLLRRSADEALSLAVGQGELTVTPLQMARLMAAIANGGLLVTPHVVERLELPLHDADDELAKHAAAPQDESGDSDAELKRIAPRMIEGFDVAKLAAVREGLRRVVADPEGTGHTTVALDGVAIAGKTGTAETSSGPDHAWFAGYAPAEKPRVAVVVVIEHGGDGAVAAGPVARLLFKKLAALGYLGRDKKSDSN